MSLRAAWNHTGVTLPDYVLEQGATSDNTEASANNGTESNHRWLHYDLIKRFHGGKHVANLINVIRARSARDECMTDNLRREVHCAAFYKRVHAGMHMKFHEGDKTEVSISRWDCQLHARIPLEIGFKPEVEADADGDAPTWSLDPDQGHILRADTDVILIPSARTVKQLVVVGPFSPSGKGRSAGASGGVGRELQRITPAAITKLAQEACADGSASWVTLFTELMTDPRAAQERYQWDFDAFVEWTTAFAVLVKVRGRHS